MTTMQVHADTLADFYATVEKEGHLLTRQHAIRWSRAVLQTLALNLDKKTKKQLAQALPEPLAEDLTRIFWLLHFRNTNISSQDFCNRVARRAGNSDWQFAQKPTQAVFHGLKKIVDDQLNRQITDTLSPELRQMWQEA